MGIRIRVRDGITVRVRASVWSCVGIMVKVRVRLGG